MGRTATSATLATFLSLVAFMILGAADNEGGVNSLDILEWQREDVVGIDFLASVLIVLESATMFYSY